MSRPTMTFSFRPRRSSVLPEIAASAATRVVSWNDAAEMKLSVQSDALVMPRRTGFAVAARLSWLTERSFASWKADLSTSAHTTTSAPPASSRQTTGDVLRARGFPHDLRDDVAHEDLGAVRDGEVRPDRQRVPVTLGGLGGRLALAGGTDDDARLQLALQVLDDHLARQTGDVV